MKAIIGPLKLTKCILTHIYIEWQIWEGSLNMIPFVFSENIQIKMTPIVHFPASLT